MPKRDKKYMAARREQIIGAAFTLMIRDGAIALSTPALCKEAGISTGALYTHFKSKDEVLAAIADRAAKRRRDHFDFHDAKEMRERLMQNATSAFDSLEKAMIGADLELFLAGRQDERTISAYRDSVDGRELERALARLARVGELRESLDPVAAAAGINALLIGARVLALMGARESTPFGSAMDMLLTAIEHPPNGD